MGIRQFTEKGLGFSLFISLPIEYGIQRTMKLESRWGSVFGWLSAITILISAFLVFQVQPIVSKTILPWFGGSPAVWTTCMLFFQVLLFAGYSYAHLVAKLRPAWQATIHLALIAASLALVPIIPEEGWKEYAHSRPTLSILLLLASTVGLPYFLLSSTGPLIQAWFGRANPGRSPYRLYALSNVGSLAALLSYPFLFETQLTVSGQAHLWSSVFGFFAISCGGLAFLACSRDPIKTASQDSRDATSSKRPSTNRAPTAFECLVWLFLAALASMMLLATTNHVCQDVAVIPFLWVLPLSLYLLTFIICFDKESWYQPRWFGLASGISILAISLFTLFGHLPNLLIEVGVYFVALFCICMICHGELVRRKPPTEHLTLFYLMCSAGGALGGVFVALICPWIFDGFFEMNLGLAISFLLAACVTVARGNLSDKSERAISGPWSKAVACLLMIVVLRAQASAVGDRGLDSSRSFYGVIRLKEEGTDDPQRQGRYMFHGRIAHGFQFIAPEKRRTPTMYFDVDSGLGITMSNVPRDQPLRVGIIGLGAGTIATYGQPGDQFRFYEINPDVERFARKYFSFLEESEAEVQVVLGDARLSMEREPPQHYDVFVLDAFSGDAIPAHLLTREAFEVYLRHLKPDGVIAANISNRHLDLEPVLGNLGAHHGLESASFFTRRDADTFRAASHWIVLSRNSTFWAQPDVAAGRRSEIGRFVGIPMWTDQFNNLFQVLK